MASTKIDPFLWIHLAGVAIAPWALQVVWIALGSTPPLTAYWLEFLAIAAVGILPVMLMQLTRPFSIYSFLLVAIKPVELSESQRQILFLFKRPVNRLFTVLTAIAMLVLLWFLYQWAPVAGLIVPFTLPSRLGAILIAAVAFALANLFIQIPVSVLLVILTPKKQVENIVPMPTESIPAEFTILGWRVNKILPRETSDASS